MNFNNEIERNRLFTALRWSYDALEPFRNLVHGLVEEYAGSAYGQGTTRPRHEQLLNLMNQTVDAYTMSLVANRPRALVSSKRRNQRYFARHFETALNNLISEIQLEYTLRQAVLDAFFCMGIVKMHLAESVAVELEPDLWADPGTPFASNISIDNWCHDMAATKYSKIQFAGDWYRLPFEDLDSDIFDQKAVKQLELKPTSKWNYGDQQDRLDRIASGGETDRDELHPMIDLFDVWIPRDKTIYTFPIDPRNPFQSSTKPIAALPWDGPEFGPYRILSFNDVPENIVPSSPASHVSGMARIINNIMRKQARRAHGQRDIMTYTPSGAKDAEKIMGTPDQGTAAVAEGSEIQMVKLGGVDGNLQAFGLGLIQLYDRMAGNLTAMAGLGNQAPTLGQEEMIQESVSKKQVAMQYRVVDFAVSIIRDLGYMLWHDRAKVIPGTIVEPGLEDYEPTDATWTPGEREGEYDDYDLAIDVFSMPYQSPSKKFATMLSLLQNVFIPAAPMLMQQGGTINFQKVAETAANLLNAPELEEWIEFGSTPPMPEEQGGAGGMPGMDAMGGMPSSTTRNYVRKSVATGGSPQNRSTMEQQAWLGQQGSGGAAMQTVPVGG